MSGMQSPLPASSNRHEPARHAPRKWVRGLIISIVLIILAAAGYAGYLYFFKVNDMLGKIGTDKAVPAGMAASEKPLTMLLLGVDSRPETGSLNTDVIMVVTLNPDSQSAVVVSIPRDTYMKASQGLKANKANAFYPNLMASSRTTAQEKIKKVFGSALNTTIDYVALVDFQGFRDIVDALGGITVDVDMNMRYVDKADGTDINLKAGVQKLSGKQALDFVRYRKSNNNETKESSDLERNARQQKVVAEILSQLKSPSIVLHAGGLLDAAGKNITTDIPSSQLKDMVRTYMGISKDKIEYIHLEGEWRSPYVYVPEADWQKARNAIGHLVK